MSKILHSKLVAWIGFVIVVVATCVTFKTLKPYWWAFAADFFAFMTVFCHLASIYLCRISQTAGDKLQRCAAVFGVVAVVSIIAECIVFSFFVL